MVQNDLGPLEPLSKLPVGGVSSHLIYYLPEGEVIQVDDGKGNTYIYDDAKRTEINIIA